jgi:hypothetical protein
MRLAIGFFYFVSGGSQTRALQDCSADTSRNKVEGMKGIETSWKTIKMLLNRFKMLDR